MAGNKKYLARSHTSATKRAETKGKALRALEASSSTPVSPPLDIAEVLAKLKDLHASREAPSTPLAAPSPG